MSRLITTTLLDSIEWCRSAPDSPSSTPGKTWREEAYEQLKSTLARLPWHPNSSILRGIDFENQIYSILDDHVEATVTCSDKFRKILMDCKGVQFQKKTKTILELDGEEYCLYGKIDVWFPDHLIDIKTTGKYGGKSKYLDTAQHHIYCYGENIRDFEYIIAEFPDDKSNTIRNVYHIAYHAMEQDKEEEYIKNRIYSAITFLENFSEPGDLKELYFTKYCRY